jgi:hypothetical protein
MKKTNFFWFQHIEKADEEKKKIKTKKKKQLHFEVVCMNIKPKTTSGY